MHILLYPQSGPCHSEGSETMKPLSPSMKEHLARYKQHHFDITCELSEVPGFSNQEEQRADWVKKYMEGFGAEGVYIDEALNVVWPIGVTKDNPVIVMMAHIDTVFPLDTPLKVVVKDGWAHCPGIGDDTVNVTTMLVVGRYIAEKKLKAAGDYGVLIVGNAGEEGLGDLKGSKQICGDYAGRIVEFTSFDAGYTGGICNDAVGSHRYRVSVTTEGGHSYVDYGNRNAIAFLTSMIQSLYTVKVPPYGKTTYNVGGISGGTSVNTIAQNAEMLYEFRSDDRRSLAEMEKMFLSVCDAYRDMGIGVKVEVLGIRPCRGDVDLGKLEELCLRAQGYIEAYNGPTPYKTRAGSTDANIPLSQGIPAITFGFYIGEGAHTREEKILIESLDVGLPMCAAYMMQYFTE